MVVVMMLIGFGPPGQHYRVPTPLAIRHVQRLAIIWRKAGTCRLHATHNLLNILYRGRLLLRVTKYAGFKICS